MSITPKALRAAAVAGGWVWSDEGTHIDCRRDQSALLWYAAGLARGVLFHGQTVTARRLDRAGVLATLQSDRDSLLAQPALLHDVLGGMITEVEMHGQRYLDLGSAPRAAVRLHLAADHGEAWLGVELLTAAEVRSLHLALHFTDRPPRWPYINPHHHVPLRHLSIGDLQ